MVSGSALLHRHTRKSQLCVCFIVVQPSFLWHYSLSFFPLKKEEEEMYRVPNKIIWISSFLKQSDLLR